MSFREFSFAYEFSARSEAEAVAIDNIIKTFRFHMHPELVQSGLFFSFPSLFDISIMFKEDNNPLFIEYQHVFLHHLQLITHQLVCGQQPEMVNLQKYNVR